MTKSHLLRNEPIETDVTELRGGLVSKAKVLETSRFKATPSVDSPSMHIQDTQTGREVQVPLFAAQNTLEALRQLFPT